MNERDYAELDQQSYVKETALTIWEGLPRLILAGMTFTLTCLPSLLIFYLGFLIPAILVGIFTIAPGWAAVHAQTAQMIYRETGDWIGFLRAFGKFYRRSLVLGAMTAVPLVAASLTLPFLADPPVETIVWAGLAADFAGVLLLSCMFIYTYPMLVLYDTNVRTALRNSLVLAARYLGNTIGLIAMAVLLAFLASKTSYFLLIVFITCWLVFVINNSRMVLRKELGGPDTGTPAAGGQ